ncbi:MAG: hypothetical protein WBA48_03520 [Xanthobacteraceae bacterium]
MFTAETKPSSTIWVTAFGVAVGLAIATPLLGRSLFISGQTISLVATAAAFLFFIFCRHDFRLGNNQLVAIGLVLLYVALVAMAAFPEQWDFLFHPRGWRDHADHYVTAKLTVFFIKTLPPIAFGVMFSVLQNRERAVKAMLLSMLATSMIAFVVLVSASDNLIRAPYAVAADWYNGIGRAEFSTISMGLILIIGAIVSLVLMSENRTRNLFISIFIGLCLLSTIMLDRRIDTALFVIAIVVILAERYFRHPTLRKSLIPTIAIILVPLTIWPFVTNDFNIEYWQTAPSGFRYRFDAFQNVVEYSTTPTYQSAGATGEIAALQKAAEDSLTNTSEISKLLRGGGLGLYAIRSDGGLLYPHNIVLETFLEIGVIAAAALLIAMAILLFPLARKLFNRTITPEEAVTAAVATVLFLISLKSGDASNIGNILLFAIVAGSIARARRESRVTQPASIPGVSSPDPLR